MGQGTAGRTRAAKGRRGFHGRVIALACVASIAAVAIALGGAGSATDLETASAVTDPPNILFIVTDDQRLEGTMVMMPKTVQWFGDHGTTFTA
jgi:hypothetical protein